MLAAALAGLAGIEQLVKQFVKGDRHARRELFELAEKVGLDLLGLHKKTITASMEGTAKPTQRDDAELTREEIANLTDEQLKTLIAAEEITREIRSRRQAPSEDTKDRRCETVQQA